MKNFTFWFISFLKVVTSVEGIPTFLCVFKKKIHFNLLLYHHKLIVPSIPLPSKTFGNHVPLHHQQFLYAIISFFPLLGKTDMDNLAAAFFPIGSSSAERSSRDLQNHAMIRDSVKLTYIHIFQSKTTPEKKNFQWISLFPFSLVHLLTTDTTYDGSML